MAFNWITKSTWVTKAYVRFFHLCSSSLHIAVTQIHTQPGLVEKLMKDTKQCVADILKSDRKDETKTVGEHRHDSSIELLRSSRR